jgi:glucosamine--fructose-6-phosphate aminotransferase (isomerizing)
MCGIIGIVSFAGGKPVAERLVDGLCCMDYRGYDSAGICTLHDGVMIRRRAEGKLANLARVLAGEPASGVVGIAQTRWATHGAPPAANAHPMRLARLPLFTTASSRTSRNCVPNSLLRAGCSKARQTVRWWLA